MPHEGAFNAGRCDFTTGNIKEHYRVRIYEPYQGVTPPLVLAHLD